jgi:tRNA-splicing ligase RtcB
VGYDIGCGVAALRTQINASEISREKLVEILETIIKTIPTGTTRLKEQVDATEMPRPYEVYLGARWRELSDNPGRWQLGTLGSGNHFIEIQRGSDGYLWIMLHSGSRNLGHSVATYYISLAKELNQKWFSAVDPKMGLSFLPVDSDEGKLYLHDMDYCLAYAKESRRIMAYKILAIIATSLGARQEVGLFYDVHHNYAAIENHFGKNVWVHRKGATRAYEGEIGIIPGSQGTNSYIVKGNGNLDSFKSCSHGAGRAMSRNVAKSSLDLEAERRKMDEKGIIHNLNSGNLDEADSAYKDIYEVMRQQLDLVDILVELTPLAVVKG